MSYTISPCRCCGNEELEDVLSLGETPLPDVLLTESQLGSSDIIVPLTLAICPDCSLVQIRETVDRGLLFNEDYPYFSSVKAKSMNALK